ncbi:Long-chain-fatty-acid--CoA ligase FadD13 [compost metagenome]
MVLSGGENIYPAEVENVLMRHPDIADGAVIGVPNAVWGEAVKACVVLRPGAQSSEHDIIEFMRANLAHYKCPKSVDFLDALPRNPSGKILKRILREPYWQGQARAIA